MVRPSIAVSILALLPCLAAAAPKASKPASKAPAPPAQERSIDTNAVHKLYLEGDFDQAINMLEMGMKYGSSFTHSDSVFFFKHLGVMYAAKYDTREKGKFYMTKLLQVEPTARILDMYASDMIYMIFKNIQDEFEVSQNKLRRAKGLVDGNSQTGPGSKEDPKDADRRRKNQPVEVSKPRSYAWVGWTLGAAAAVGGVVLLVHVSEEQQASEKDNEIP